MKSPFTLVMEWLTGEREPVVSDEQREIWRKEAEEYPHMDPDRGYRDA